jgi:hypothetical protein
MKSGWPLRNRDGAGNHSAIGRRASPRAVPSRLPSRLAVRKLTPSALSPLRSEATNPKTNGDYWLLFAPQRFSQGPVDFHSAVVANESLFHELSRKVCLCTLDTETFSAE